jgi:hypothetical protein
MRDEHFTSEDIERHKRQLAEDDLLIAESRRNLNGITELYRMLYRKEKPPNVIVDMERAEQRARQSTPTTLDRLRHWWKSL